MTAKSNRIYLHLLHAPEQQTITLPGLNGKIARVTLLENNQALKCKISHNGQAQTIRLPGHFNLDGKVKVLALELDKGYTITPMHVISGKGTLVLNRQNAVKQYSFSGVDYESYYRSTVGQSWAFRSPGTGKKTIQLRYTEQEKGRQVWLDIDGKKQQLTLNAQQPVASPADVSWGPVYLSNPYPGGIDGGLPAVDSSWTLLKDQESYESAKTLPADPSTYRYVRYEITAHGAQSYLLGISSGDGVQVFLNGVEQTAHNNPDRGTMQKEILQLPLQDGKNELLIKLYNRFNKQLRWDVDMKTPQNYYTQELTMPQATGANGIHRISVGAANPVSVHRDLRLPNLELHIQ